MKKIATGSRVLFISLFFILAFGAIVFVTKVGRVNSASVPAPTNLTGAATSKTSVTLFWRAPSGGTGIAGYDVYRNGKLIASIATPSYTDTNVVSSTSYVYTVDAYNASHTKSPKSTSFTVSTNTVATAANINTPGWADSAFISRDGQRLYFMYARYNFFPFFWGQDPVLIGPERPGHHDTQNPWADSDIYVATKNANGTWGTPVNLSFNDDRPAYSAYEVIVGTTTKLYYNTTSDAGDQIVVYRVKNADGSWGPETSVGANINLPGTNNYNENLAAGDDGMWFTSNRPGGLGGTDIWFSQKVNGVWGTPINVGAPVNTATDEDQFWTSPITGQSFFARDNVTYTTTWGASGFTTPVLLQLGLPAGASYAQVTMPDSSNELFFISGDPATSRVKIYHDLKLPNGSWGTATPID